MEEKRYGFAGIFVEREKGSVKQIQDVLSDYSACILGRMGLPHIGNDNLSIITLILYATTDEIGSLTGKLGSLPGVTVKSGISKNKS